jgi:Ca-activated chloride channel family protein
MNFASGKILWLLLVIPPVMVAFFFWSWHVRRELMAQFIQARLLPGLIAGVSARRQKIRAALVIGAVACFIVALARPQWGYFQEEVPQRGLDIIVAIDTSKSMLANDISPNRLARAKLAAMGLMQESQSDRLGVVAFAGSAFLECPLTVDSGAFQQSVDALNVNAISEGGSSLAEAIDTAANAFKEGDNYKVLVLFTDGEDNDTGDAGVEDAAKRAAKDGLKIFTVGIGTAAGELLQYRDQNGNVQYVRDDQNNVVKSHLNESLLRKIAADAGGAYYSLSGANTMEALYQRSLAPLPKSEAKEAFVKRPYERYHWPLALGIVLLIAEMFFPERKPGNRRGTKGQPPVADSSGVAPAVTAAIVALLILPAVGFASPQSAMRDYKAGKFVEAQKEFERLAAEDKKGDLRFIFNAGDAAYRATNYDDALKDYVAATSSQDVKLQQKAYFNIGNVLYQQGQAKLKPDMVDLDAVQEQWEQAVKSFHNAVTLDMKDDDATNNLAFAEKSVAMIKQLKLLAQQAKQAADNSVKQRQYHRALEIMQQVVQRNIAAKQFEDYVKRLQNIDEIATPNQAPKQP